MDRKSLRRIFIALGVSFAANIVFLSSSNSTMGRLADRLDAPSDGAATWIAWNPWVHDPIDIFSVFVSIVTYNALLIWIAISLPSWWRHRA
jgi:hypothetical protein